MKISKVSIKNFRSIKEAEIELTDFNILVGQNNCGKTNFFEALDWFFNGLKRPTTITDIRFGRNPEQLIVVDVEFTGVQAGLELMKHAVNRSKISKLLNGMDAVTVRKDCINGKRNLLIDGGLVDTGTGFEAALNDFLPKFEYITTKHYYDSVAKYAKTTPMGIMLSDVLTEILTENPQYKDFQTKFSELFEHEDSQVKAEFESIGGKVQVYLQQQFPDCTSVKFKVAAPVFEDLLKNFDTSINDGIETSAEEKGDGMQRALMLAIIQAYADFRKSKDEEGKTFLFFIDEAELHLHPSAQRNLKNVLFQLAEKNDQVFINTHSSVLVVDDLKGQSIFKAEKHLGETTIFKVEDSDKHYIVYELLGGSPADLLLPKNFLIVEGKSEQEFLNRVIKRFYADMPKIQIIPAEGDVDQVTRTINSINKAYSPINQSIYKERAVILIDLPHEVKEAGVMRFLSDNKRLKTNGQFFVLHLRDLEQCYPDQPCEIYVNWQKSQSEVDCMVGTQKFKLAKHVGANITQLQFETNLKTCFEALKRCWELSYN